MKLRGLPPWVIDLALIALFFLLAAALSALPGCATVAKLVPREPILAQCDAKCYTPCVAADGDTGIRWDGSPTDPAMFDRLADQVTLPLADRLRACDVNRQACTQCLDRLKSAGVIR